MARTYRLEESQFIPLPRSEVFAFFSDAANLERITPEFLRFRILSPLPIDMKPGAIIDYRLKLFGIPFEWRTVIREWEPEARFMDTQERGPYTKWEHTHRFHEVPGGTLVVDTVDYALPLGPLGALAHWLFVRRNLRTIFSHRHERIDELLVRNHRRSVSARLGPASTPVSASA